VRSRAKEDVIREVTDLANNGYKEVVLTGIHLSSYGVDLEGEDLLSLILAVNDVAGIERIRLGSLEPRIITEEFAKTIAGLTKMCPHFHLSLQSGSNATLKRMNRKYSAEEYFEKCELLRKYFENPALTTDVIVGFPGETEEEFEETISLIQQVHYDSLFTFIFSPRMGTPAASMDDPTPKEEKNRRFDKLCAVQNSISVEIHNAYVGKTMRCLIDGTDKEFLTARTEGGRLVRLKGDLSLVGSFAPVTITGATTWSLTGELCTK
jgi:threonylcarbamoyladenosine tRNA methylthiotransferase MtaB